jgi:hypothetical protein
LKWSAYHHKIIVTPRWPFRRLLNHHADFAWKLFPSRTSPFPLNPGNIVVQANSKAGDSFDSPTPSGDDNVVDDEKKPIYDGITHVFLLPIL